MTAWCAWLTFTPLVGGMLTLLAYFSCSTSVTNEIIVYILTAWFPTVNAGTSMLNALPRGGTKTTTSIATLITYKSTLSIPTMGYPAWV